MVIALVPRARSLNRARDTPKRHCQPGRSTQQPPRPAFNSFVYSADQISPGGHSARTADIVKSPAAARGCNSYATRYRSNSTGQAKITSTDPNGIVGINYLRELIRITRSTWHYGRFARVDSP